MENWNRDFIWKKIAISICGRGTGINKSGSGNTFNMWNLLQFTRSHHIVRREATNSHLQDLKNQGTGNTITKLKCLGITY
jgi:hypothetical protein